MMLLFAASLFFTTPAPVELPRAEAFLVKESGVRRLEDRYYPFDLWTSRAIIGRWFEDDRTFVLSRLDVLPPAMLDAPVETRTSYDLGLVSADPKDKDDLVRMVDLLSPIEPAEKFSSPRQMPRGYKDVRYCHGTNTSAIVCAFRPEKSSVWYLATWELNANDVFEEKLAQFEKQFLDLRAWEKKVCTDVPSKRGNGDERAAPSDERALLRADVHHGVAAYEQWHVTDSEDFVVVDDLVSRSWAVALTNELPRWRARFAAVMPTPIDGTNTLAVARIYADSEDYINAAGEEMWWSAAYWNPLRRELVARMPEGGFDELRKTIHHEAFHQYLSYATAMITTSPWLNEGYAQYFEDEDSTSWGFKMTPEQVDRLAVLLPALLQMDYKQFYAGTNDERHLKYKLAWSLAVFLEKGAPLVRFEPFQNLKRDYIEALLKTHNMHEATDTAFRSSDFLAQFITEWKRFWKNQ